MAAHLTEEEQIEAIKRWWKDNGKFTVGLILAVVLGWFGWTSWQDRQERLAQDASRRYSELMATLDSRQGAALTEEQASTARLIASELVEMQEDSLYGNLAGLVLTRLALDSGNLAEAETQLRQLKSAAANEAMAQLSRLRLARVLAAQEQFEAALTELSEKPGAGYAAAFAEVRGDIYTEQGKLDLARTAYQEAMAQLTAQQSQRSGLIQLKLTNTSSAASAVDEPAPATEEGGA